MQLAQLKSIPAAEFFGNENSPNFYGRFYADVEMYTNCASGLDMQSYLGSWTIEEISGKENNWLGSNVPRYFNEAYDQLYAELQSEADTEKRAELIKQLNDMLMQDYVMLPLTNRGTPSAVANSLQGYRPNVWGTGTWNIADWTRASN